MKVFNMQELDKGITITRIDEAGNTIDKGTYDDTKQLENQLPKGIITTRTDGAGNTII